MKKRILSACIALSNVVGIFSSGIAMAEEISNTDELNRVEQICIGLGCITGDEYNRDKTVTRAEFADIIANLCSLDVDSRYEEWNNSAYGDIKESEILVLDKNSEIFYDVDKSHPFYNEISAVYRAGYMKGISERRFAPEYDITVFEVSKVIADMLGYAKMAELSGGYPVGYESVISRIGLVNGVQNRFNDIATQGDIIKIVYNALDINMNEVTISDNVNYSKSDKTFMEGVLKTYKVRGAFTDNGITAVNSESALRKDEIKVAGVIATLPEKLNDYKKLIGRNVEMYYSVNDDTDEYVVKYIAPATKDIAVSFDIEDFVGYENGVIEYLIGKKVFRERIDANANLIYNNKYLGVYNESVFDFEAGNVTLSSLNGDKYDVIIINAYDFVYVESKNDTEKQIFNGLKKNNDIGINVVELTEEKYPDYIIIKDAEGNSRGFDDIGVGDVLNILENQNGIEIIISKNIVKGFNIKSKSKSELGRTVIANESEKYEVLDAYTQSIAAKDFALNSIYDLYFNMFQKVVWVSDGKNDEYKKGIITKVIFDADEELRIIKLYNDSGKLVRLNAPKKIALNGKSGKFEDMRYKLEELIGEIVLYKIDTDGNISSVTSAADFMDEKAIDRGWHRINPKGSYTFGTNGYDLSGFFYFVRGKTQIFTVPTSIEDFSEESNFSVGKVSLKDNVAYEAEGFAASPNAVEADVILLRQAASSGGSVDSQSVFLIQSIEEGLTSDDEIVKNISGYIAKMNSGTAEYATLQVDPEAVMVAMGDPAEVIDQTADIEKVGPRTIDELQPGDVIRYNTNTKGMVDVIRIAYDCDMQKPYHGSRGREDANYAQASSFAGWAISKESGGVRFTKDIKPEHINYKNTAEVLANVKAMRLNNVPILVVEKRGSKVNVRVGSMNDIVTYNDTRTGNNYDRIAVFTYYSGTAYGAVVYK